MISHLFQQNLDAADPSPVQPCKSRRAGRSARERGLPGNVTEPERAPKTLAIVRSFMAKAATRGTGSAPEARA
jgi:hypothetical protein